MNKIAIFLTAVVLTACGGKKEASLQSEAFSTDSLVCELDDSVCEVYMCADYPVAGPSALVNILQEYICEEMGVDTRLRTKGDAVLHEGADIMHEALKSSWNSIEPMEDSDKPTLFGVRNIRKVSDTAGYVSYLSVYEDYQGGAHGSRVEIGTTFRKSDGRRFGWDLLKNTDSDAFRLLLKEGLRQYLLSGGVKEALTDEGLQSLLLYDGSVDYLPLPHNAPYLTEQGIVFAYQQYEIAPYALGIPTFTLNYQKIEPYLSSAVKEMLEEGSEKR